MNFGKISRLFFIGFLLILSPFLLSCEDKIEISDGYDFAFINVNVVSFENETEVLYGQTILIKDGLIQSISPANELLIAESIPKIDGGGKAYLMPGLVDTHTHINNEKDVFLLPLFLANGVTTIFNMSGTNRTLKIRDQIVSGELLGPTMYTAGPMFQLPGVTSVEDAERVFNDQLEAGYDFIKIYGDLRPDAHQTVGRLGKNTTGIGVVGHAPRNLPFESVVESEQAMLAHLEEIIYTKFQDRDLDKLPDFSHQVAENSDLYITPTLITFSYIVEQWGRPAVIDKYLESDRSKFLSPDLLEEWTDLNYYTIRDPETTPRRNLEFQKIAVVELFQAGVPLLSGTDTPLPLVYPGYSLLEELEFLHNAGIPDAAVLKIGSWNAGQFFREHVDENILFGAVKPGYRADLVMLDFNPLEDIENLKNPAGVMVAGRWLSREYLGEMLDTMVTEIQTFSASGDTDIEAFPMTVEQMEAFTGRFVQAEPYIVIDWFIKDGELYNGEPDSEQKFRMIPVGETTFRFADFPVEMLAEFSEGNSHIIMTVDGSVNGDFRLQEED